MTKEQLIALGLTEEQATKAAAASAEELKTYVPITRFNEVNTAKKTAEDTLKERDTQLETLSKDAGASEALKAEITRLQGENKTAKEQYEANIKDMALTNAIKSALAGKAHDEGLVAGLFDKTKLVIDGDRVVGLDEQLTGLQKDKAFLFKTETTQQQQKPPGFQVGGGGNPTPPAAGGASFRDAVTAHFQTKS